MAKKRQKIPGVYAILNTETGGTYIGSSRVDVIHRIDQHICSMKKGHPIKSINLAVQEYGLEAFSFLILEECSPEDCRIIETIWLQSWHPEYNSCFEDANSSLGYKHTEEAKVKMTVAQTGRPSNFRGHTLSEEAKARIGAANHQHWLEKRINAVS